MRKMKKLFWMFCLAMVPMLQSCDNDDDGYSIGDFTPPLWATAHVSLNSFYLDCDVWGTLWPLNTDLSGIKLDDRQRVITSFNPIYDDFQGYDHAVKLLSLHPVLTKKVEVLTAGNEEELGNDPVTIYKGDMTISGNHLNIVFVQNVPNKEKHRISLVRPENDADLVDEEGYLRLELRYNDYDDLSGYNAYGIVSYDLSDFSIDDHKGVVITIHSSANGEGVEVVFENTEFDNEHPAPRLATPMELENGDGLK